MGHYKELLEKQKAGTITEEETQELKELQADVDEVTTSDDEAAEEEKAIEDAADSIAEKAVKNFQDKIAPLTALAEKLSSADKDANTSDNSEKFVVDSKLGNVSVKQLEEEKVELSERKLAGKKHYTVSMKSVHFVQALMQGDRQKLQTLVEGTGSRGGYLVPEDFVNLIIEDRRDLAIMRQLATVIPVSTDTIHIPNLAARPKAFWRTEAAVKNTSTVDFGETVLTPYSLASIVSLSNELVADARLGGPIVNLVAGYMARSLAEEEEKAFWTGNGSGRPTGIDNYSFTTYTAAAGASDSVKADTVIRAIFGLQQSYRANAVWVANKNTWAKIATLKDSQNNYLLSDLGSAASPTLRGLRTYEQNDIGDGKMFLGDFSYYYIADREGVQVDISTEATVASQSAFERNLTFIRVEERVDGELTLTQPIVEVQGIGGF